jgi:hypothetical protein
MARYPAATWRGPVPNVGGAMRRIRFGVVHVMQGSLWGTDAWFRDPSSQVSAHLGIGRDGRVLQWVDTSQVAWAEADYNDAAISIELEGVSGEAMTPVQEAALVAAVVWVRETTTLPAVLGCWVGHGQLGVPGGNHPDCPGAPILDQLPAVMAAANPQPVQESVFMLPSGCTDRGAFNAQMREWWTTYRSDTLGSQDLYWFAWSLPQPQGGFQMNPDLLLAHIIDTAGPHLRPAFAGAI